MESKQSPHELRKDKDIIIMSDGGNSGKSLSKRQNWQSGFVRSFLIRLAPLLAALAGGIAWQDSLRTTSSIVSRSTSLLDAPYYSSLAIDANVVYQNESIAGEAAGATSTNTASGIHPLQGSERQSQAANCFEHNTQKWIDSKVKLDNIDVLTDFGNDISVLDSWFETNLIDAFPRISARTLCHADGEFRSVREDVSWNATDVDLIEAWSTKLLYLAIHSYMHAPARAEYRARRSCQELDINPYDLECKNARYLVARVSSIGMGASFRLGVVTTLLAAVATDRIPIFVNNLGRKFQAYHEQEIRNISLVRSEASKFLSFPLRLVSCDRKDIQCMLLPTSPCVPTLEEVMSAPHMDRGQTRRLKRNGVLPEGMESFRVISFFPEDMPSVYGSFPNIRKKIQARLAREAEFLVRAWSKNSKIADGFKKNQEHSEKLRVLQMAAKRIAINDKREENVNNYSNRGIKFAEVAMMYFMRPRPHVLKRVDETVRSVVPDSLDPSNALGMPVRGSDKCRRESTCLPFQKYMQLAEETWVDEYSHKAPASGHGDLILTTEDPQLFAQRHAHSNASHLEDGGSFPWSLVVNEADVMQGSGSTRAFGNSAEDIMVSSFVALQMQFRARKVYGNCCSNFHMLLFDFLRNGCGMVRRKEDAVCMQETEKYNMCCQWTRSAVCNRMREAIANKTA